MYTLRLAAKADYVTCSKSLILLPLSTEFLDVPQLNPVSYRGTSTPEIYSLIYHADYNHSEWTFNTVVFMLNTVTVNECLML
jgi:hypothetical protein